METTTITLHTKFQIGQVDPRIFGGFLEHMGRAVYEGVYDPKCSCADEDGFRTDVLAALRRLRMTTMRYPGGNFASDYHWMDGVGPRDQRPTVCELAWESIEPNRFGTDEYIRLCRKMEWTPMLTVNLGTGTPEEARNWVEYCNSPAGTKYADMRVANGHTEPHAVKLWCLGNEMEWDRQVLEYMGDLADYVSLHEKELSDYEALRGDNIAALLHHLGTIQPGETTRLITQLGQDESAEKALPSINRYRDAEQVERALKEMAAFWDTYLSRLQVETPDANMNSLLNIHNPRQCHTTKNWSRYLSLYQLGLGARGIGFRDSSQDVIGILVSMPEEGKELIKQLLHVQKRDGSAMHQFNPLTMVANEGDSREVEDGPKYYGDDHLWIVLAIAAYLKETGDLAVLDEVIPYYEKDKKGHPLESGTVLDHMQRAIEFTQSNVGAHGLPLLGFADWNDTVNLRMGAESLFVANLYGKALLEMIELARHLGDAEVVAQYTTYYETMKQRVNEHAWDGEWFVRYFDADGSPLGSRLNTEGQIYANGQSWPVISGFAPPDRAKAALDAVYRWLNTHKGIKLSTPGYDGFDPAKGGITTYPPGAKENGGIFLHTNPWVIIAETIVGNGDRAFEYYHQINPVAKNDVIDEFECEPYVYPQNILGDEHPQFGLARNSWLSGTASWAYQAGTQYILGVRPTYEGLQVHPCIPAKWDSFKVTREFRKAVYQIEVKNPDHVCKGVKSVKVDGKEMAGNVVPVLGDGRMHQVEVIMREEVQER